jgi:hypothetical protein
MKSIYRLNNKNGSETILDTFVAYGLDKFKSSVDNRDIIMINIY